MNDLSVKKIILISASWGHPEESWFMRNIVDKILGKVFRDMKILEDWLSNEYKGTS